MMQSEGKKESEMKNKAKVICFSNHKGGVGKTCSTCNIGVGLSRLKHKVMIIDLDPQGNLSLSLGIKDINKSIYNAIKGECPLSDVTYPLNRYLHVVPANLDLSGAEIDLVSQPGREVILRELISEELQNYDFILIDCPPSLGLLTLNALSAATDVIIPLQAQYLAMQGLATLDSVIKMIKMRINKELSVSGVIITQYDNRIVLNRDVAASIREHFGDKVFKTNIRNTVSLAEAPSSGKDIFRYKANSLGAQDYQELCEEIVNRYSQKKELAKID